MSRTTPPSQLNLQLSLTESVDLQERLERCESWAKDMAADNAKLTAQIEQLKKSNRAWERSYRVLEAENTRLMAHLADARAELHELREQLHQVELRATQDSLRLQDEVQELTRAVIEHRTRAEFWERLASIYLRLRAESSAQREPVALRKDALTKLLTLAHPDRWSQGQLATELAHELSVAINALRERMEVRA